MAAGAAEAVIEVEVPERGIQIIVPHQTNDPAAQPDAFRVSAWAIDSLRSLDKFVGFALIFLVRFGRIGGRRLAGLVGGGGTALGENRARSDQEGKACNGEVAQNRNFEIRPTSTHTFFPRLVMAWLVAVQIGPQCGGDAAGFP